MIIDVHTHVVPEPGDKTRAYAANLAYLDEAGVNAAVLLPLPPVNLWPDVFERIVPATEAALAAARAHPDRFIPFGVFDPRGPRAGFAGEMARLVAAGCRGFGEFKPYPPDNPRVDDERCREVFGLAGEAHLPVLPHLDGQINLDIDGFESVVADYPATTFIAHGPTWWREMAAEPPAGDWYPTGPVSRPGRVDRMLARYPNLYADMSAGSGLRALSRDLAYTRGFVAGHWQRLLFGTDFPCINGATKQRFGVDRSHQALVASLDLPSEQRDAILSGNLLRILRPA
ncbi:MAG: amidohydrolase family protein [Anaerolineae bacterium]